jgi:hypothetical protein
LTERNATQLDTWIFTAPDTWTPAATPAPDWPDDVGDDAYMASLGYRQVREAPNYDIVEFVGAWSLWMATDRATCPRYGLLLWTGYHSALVWLPTLPDLMAYMARYETVGQAPWLTDDINDFREVLNKLFRAWHGHHAEAVCPECAPDEYKRLQETRARLVASRKRQQGA